MSLPTLLLKKNLIATKYSEKQSILDEYRPIDYITEWFDKKVARDSYSQNPSGKSPADKILLVRSSTGSGKSTVMPSELFHKYFDRVRRNIAVTQPRVFNAVDIPTNQIIPYNTKEKLKEFNLSSRTPLVLEENIGYQTKAFTKKKGRGLIFMTIGVLTQHLKILTPKEFMDKYAFIIIDEAHEQSIDASFVLMMLKKFIQKHYKNPMCPFLIVTSATFDVYKFCDYLLSDVGKSIRYKNIVDVSGFSHPITDVFLEYPSENLVATAIETASNIHKDNIDDLNDTFRDILIFVSGAADIKKIVSGLESTKFENPIICIPLTRSDIQGETQNFRNLTLDYKIITGNPTRRIIIATNVGETGITYQNLKYVIDTGFYNSSEFDPTLGVELLINKVVTKGMFRQRRGRSGRNAPGFSYPLYTKETHDNFLEDAYPAIIKEEITLNILDLLIRESDPETIHTEMTPKELVEQEYSQKPVDINKIDLLDSPTADSWHYSIEKLYTLNCINRNTLPTKLGVFASKITSLRLESIMMILSGYAWDFPIIDLITLACFLEERRDDIYPRRLAENYDKAVKDGVFTIHSSLFSDDFINYLILFYKFKKAKMDKTYAEDNGFSADSIGNVIVLRDQIMHQLASLGFNPYHLAENRFDSIMNQNATIDDIISYLGGLKQCIYEGFKLNTASISFSSYITKRAHIKLDIVKPSCNIVGKFDPNVKDNPKFILFDKIRYMRSRTENIYDPIVDNICVLDGYIPWG
jgi:African swine fever virus helicase